MRPLLLLHALLLLLASTDFTIVTAMRGDDSLRWSYFTYASQDGFGRLYISDYTLLVILTYLAAFAVGLVGFSMAVRQRRSVTGGLGVILSMLGLISFGIEGSHWLVDHHRSWLAFSPAAMLVLAMLACRPGRGRATDQAATKPQIG